MIQGCFHWKNWTWSYFQNICRLFLEYFHTTDNILWNWTKLEIGFSNLFLQYLQNIPILWKRSHFPVLNPFTPTLIMQILPTIQEEND